MNTDNSVKELFNQAMSEFVGQNFKRSIDLLDELIARDGHNRLALVARGSAHLKLDNLPAALADFDHAVESDPHYARTYHLRGLAHERKGELEDALGDFSRAIQLDPEYGAAYYSRATLYQKMGRSEAATEDIEMVTHLTNRNIESFANENNVWRSQQMRVETMIQEG
jgi:tetratricopeptide (TPR) repeat protein